MPATQQDICQFSIWEEAMKTSNDHEEPDIRSNDDVARDNWTAPFRQMDTTILCSETGGGESNPTNPSSLNEQQQMAFDLVTSHLQAHPRNEQPPQRLMIMHGQGGTGKTAMLNAISKVFDDLGASHLLVKMAMSGVAASLIGGQTLHSWAVLPVRTPKTEKWITHPGKEVGLWQKRNFAVLWLTIDEMSILTTPLFDHLSQATGIVCTGLYSIDPSTAFGGLSIMLLGDFHQLPPVAVSKCELYHSSPPDDSSGFG
jgi:hypothetical protein